MGFPTRASRKRKTLPLLIQGVLPIFTQLRAKKYYNQLLAHSCHWNVAKLFRGAQSSGLNYCHSGSTCRKKITPAASSCLDLHLEIETPAGALQKILALKRRNLNDQSSLGLQRIRSWPRQPLLLPGVGQAKAKEKQKVRHLIKPSVERKALIARQCQKPQIESDSIAQSKAFQLSLIHI